MADDIASYVTKNRNRFATVSPPRSESYFTESFWRRQLASLEESPSDAHVSFGVYHNDHSDRMIGHIYFSQISRGAFQSCYVGYGIDGDFEGRGLMFQAMSEAVAFAFNRLGLHRIQANYRPENVRSGRLLRRLGFTPEGFARDYLFLGGAWRDHILTALLNPSSREPTA